MKVTTSVLQNSFGKYLKMVMDGERITVMKNNKPVAELTWISTENKNLLREEAVEYTADHKVSYEEFKKLYGEDETESKYELIDGVVYAMTSPLFSHQMAVSKIIALFTNWFSGKLCIPIVAPFDVKLSNGAPTFEEDPNVVQPDVLVICDSDKIDDEGRYEGVPTLVVEVLSKSTKSKDLFVKANLYMNSGVSEYWIVDTDLNQVTVYWFEEGKIKDNIICRQGDIVQSYFFEGLKLEVDMMMLRD